MQVVINLSKEIMREQWKLLEIKRFFNVNNTSVDSVFFILNAFWGIIIIEVVINEAIQPRLSCAI